MDFLNEKDIHDKIVDPAIDKIDHETIPALERAVDTELKVAAEQVSMIIAGTLAALQGTADKAVADIRSVVAGLDGWSVEIGPITIPAFPIRLSAPKGQ